MKLQPLARFEYDPVYRANYAVVVSRPNDFRSSLRKLLKRAPVDVAEIMEMTAESIDDCDGRCWRLRPQVAQKNAYLYVIWVRAGVDVSVLVHELLHAVIHCFHDRGVEIALDHEEALTYYVQMLLRWAMGVRR